MKAKDEALAALQHIKSKLEAFEISPSGLERRLLLATADHAIEMVGAIQEVKKQRKVKAA